jgi:sigma-B regulation protein RsbU (phosphoserine phosphatase)
LLIADVAGHGVSAAMLTGIVKSAFHASHVDGFEPMAVVQRVRAGIAAFSPERFVTLVAVLVDPPARCLRYVNAGHPPMALWRGTREPVWLGGTGPLVTPVLPAATWEVPVVPIGAGHQLLLYTDGVSEAIAGADGCADARLIEAFDRTPSGGALLLDAILADIQLHLAGEPQPDDVTLVTARILATT